MRIDIGLRVHTYDGHEIGTVQKVVANPNTHEVDAIVVHGGTGSFRDISVPMSLIQEATKDRVILRVDQKGLSNLPDYTGEGRSQPGQPPLHDIAMSAGTQVMAVDGPIGVVDEVKSGPMSGSNPERITSIMVKAGMGLSRDIDIPIEFIDEVSEGHIKVSLTRQQVEDLPQPTADRYVPVRDQDSGQG